MARTTSRWNPRLDWWQVLLVFGGVLLVLQLFDGSEALAVFAFLVGLILLGRALLERRRREA